MRFGLRGAALAAVALSLAWTIQPPGMMQNAHYALVKAFEDGTPRIDRTVGETGDLGTNDVARYDGGLYANKAPGLAATLLPAYAALDAVGMRTTGDPQRMLWALALVGAVLPALLLTALVAWASDRIEPGFGVAAGVTVALGTLVLPFAQLLLSHVLAAALGFAAFALLWGTRTDRRLLPAAAAGLLVGAAVVVDYPTAIVAAVLAGYAAACARPVAGAYLAGLAVGVAPLLAYNAWAFGSPFRLSYQVAFGSQPQVDLARARPSLDVLFHIVAGPTGLLRLAPVLGVAALGLALLARRGFAAEAAVAVAVTATFLVYASSYGPSFGGYGAGPRYVIPAIPFLALGLAPAFRRVPSVTTLLAAVSIGTMATVVATGTLGAHRGDLFGRLVRGEVVAALPSLVGVTGAIAVVPLLVAAASAAALAAASVPVAPFNPPWLRAPRPSRALEGPAP